MKKGRCADSLGRLAMVLVLIVGCGDREPRRGTDAIPQAIQRELQDQRGQVTDLGNQVALLHERLRELEAALLGARGAPGEESAAGSTEFDVGTVYERARADYEAKRYDLAAGEFLEILAGAPQDRLADNAQYWLGECFYALRDYRQALKEFARILGYAETEKADDAQLMIAYCYSRLGEPERAHGVFLRFLERHPGSEFVPLAQRWLVEFERQ